MPHDNERPVGSREFYPGRSSRQEVLPLQKNRPRDDPNDRCARPTWRESGSASGFAMTAEPSEGMVPQLR